jgi:phospholipid/cholesterol/gamma-HCH transport system substrate-binding protein
VVVIAVILLNGGGEKEYKLRFLSAGGLVKRNEVQVGGRKIGEVKDVTLSDNNQAEVKISVEEPYAPLHQGTTATIRQLSLSGIANRYVALSPGPNNAKELAEGATIQTQNTTTIVDLDQLFNTLNPPTREGLRNTIRGFADWYSGNSVNGKPAAPQFNQAARYFSPFLSTTDQLVKQLTADQPTLNRFVADTSRVVSTLAAREPDLTALVGNANKTSAAIGDESAALSQTLAELPPTLRKANTTFVNLRATLDDLDPLVNASKVATKRLEPFLKILRPLVRDAAPTIRDLSALINTPGSGNDAIDLLKAQPRLTQLAESAFPNTVRALRSTQDVVTFGRPYAPETIAFLRDFGQSAGNYDANGHFARVSPMFNAFSLVQTPTGNTLSQIPPSQKQLGLQTGLKNRCPGSATQTAPDGSNPFLDGGNLTPGTSAPADCDPSAIPMGSFP